MKIAVFGYGGHAREVAVQINQPIDFFVDDNYVNEFTKPLSSFEPNEYLMIVAVADCKEREKIVDRLPQTTKYLTFIHPSAQILSSSVKIGEGSFIGANSILTINISLGKHSILNRGNHIGHDTKIGDYFSGMPGAIVSGNVTIGKRVYLGTNSSIIEKQSLCDDVIIGSNGVVVKNIKQPGTYVGVPVNFLQK
jgi:sugar O-acyltransferase (sialic acid O-acetyltransferase NeuD family)